MFLSVIRWLWYLNPYLLYLFVAMLFITSGKRTRMMILLYCMISTYDMIAYSMHEIRLVLACHTAVFSIPRILCLRIC